MVIQISKDVDNNGDENSESYVCVIMWLQNHPHPTPNQKWYLTLDGFIQSGLDPNLVLDTERMKNEKGIFMETESWKLM